MAEQTSGNSDERSDSPSVVGWRFWLWWVLASVVALGVGGPVGMALGRSGDIIDAGFMGVTVGGILVGVLQWLVLHRQISRAGWWVPANIVAVAATGVVVFGVGMVNADEGWVLGVILFGAVVGGVQWLVLRRQVARAGWWVLASAVGWVVGGFLSGAVPVGWYLGWAVIGAVYGAITGTVLVRLLRQRPPGFDEHSH